MVSYDLGVVDVSFISLTKILPALAANSREAVLLVKPQFEVGRSRVGKKGVVRDTYDQAGAIFQVLQTATVGMAISQLNLVAGNWSR